MVFVPLYCQNKKYETTEISENYSVVSKKNNTAFITFELRNFPA